MATKNTDAVKKVSYTRILHAGEQIALAVYNKGDRPYAVLGHIPYTDEDCFTGVIARFKSEVDAKR